MVLYRSRNKVARWFLGTFAELWKGTICFVMSLCIGQLVTCWNNFCEILYGFQINHQLDATISPVYYPEVFTTQRVSGVLTPIIRSSTTAVAASGFTFVSWWQPCCSWSGRPARPRTKSYCHHDTKVKPEAATAVIELLVMGGKTSETCCTVNKRRDNKMENCCIRLVIYLNCSVRMHGLTNLKFKKKSATLQTIQRAGHNKGLCTVLHCAVVLHCAALCCTVQ